MTKPTSGTFEIIKGRIALNKNNAAKKVCFIGNQLCFFEADVDTSKFEVDALVEVMITRALFGMHPEGHKYAGRPDYHFLRALVVRPVDLEQHVLINAKGFTRNNETEETTSTGVVKGKRTELRLIPGRTGVSIVPEGDLPTTIQVWANKSDITPDNTSPIMIVGLTRISDGRWSNLVRNK